MTKKSMVWCAWVVSLAACGATEPSVGGGGAPGSETGGGGNDSGGGGESGGGGNGPDTGPDPVDLHSLPIGKAITTYPAVGAIWHCETDFSRGMGARAYGDWIHEDDDTFDVTAKPTVDGEVYWNSEFESTVVGDKRHIVGNGLPSFPTGVYPVSRNDDACEFDCNPSSIQEKSIDIELPAIPELADSPSCLSFGATGIMLAGHSVYHSVDTVGRDAVAYELLDRCGGQSDGTGTYHQHYLSECIPDSAEGHSLLMGYMRDGFGLYGPKGEDGEVLRTEDLDECHGHVHAIEWDGEMRELYHYHFTYEWPYIIGCFRGSVVVSPWNR